MKTLTFSELVNHGMWLFGSFKSFMQLNIRGADALVTFIYFNLHYHEINIDFC